MVTQTEECGKQSLGSSLPAIAFAALRMQAIRALRRLTLIWMEGFLTMNSMPTLSGSQVSATWRLLVPSLMYWFCAHHLWERSACYEQFAHSPLPRGTRKKFRSIFGSLFGRSLVYALSHSCLVLSLTFEKQPIVSRVCVCAVDWYSSVTIAQSTL